MTQYTGIKTDTRPRLVFVGTGWIGFNRMKALVEQDLCIPLAIYDKVRENSGKALALAPKALISSSFEELLEIKPDGMVIATPSALHAGQSIKALEQGIAVFCQKPLARNSAESREVIGTARKNNQLLGVDLSYRHTEGMQQIRQLTRGNRLGKIFAVDLVFHNAYGPDKEWFYDPVLSGGGCLIDLGIHLVDLALWILDFPDIRRVSSSLLSRGNKIQDPGKVTEDYVAAQLETDRDTVIRLTCSWNLPAGKEAEIRAAFYGSEGAAVFSNVLGSFYDFETTFNQGTTGKKISMPPDDWGGRALIAWTKKLQKDPGFDDEILEYEYIAELIDRIYGKTV
jgi:predicted dehydrogenase